MTDRTGVNVDLLRQTMDAVLAHPDLHNQQMWATKTECGTAYCFAGWACHLSGFEPDFWNDTDWTGLLTTGEPMDEAAKKLLGLDPASASALFRATNTTAILKDYVDQIGEHGRVVEEIFADDEVPS